MAICLCYGVDIRLKNSMVEKISLFLTLVDLHEFLGDCLIAFQLNPPCPQTNRKSAHCPSVKLPGNVHHVMHGAGSTNSCSPRYRPLMMLHVTIHQSFSCTTARRLALSKADKTSFVAAFILRVMQQMLGSKSSRC